MKCYKIVNKEGKYSSGGLSPKFTSNGKMWHQIGHVKNHLRQFTHGDEYYTKTIKLTDLEIVEMEIRHSAYYTVKQLFNK